MIQEKSDLLQSSTESIIHEDKTFEKVEETELGAQYDFETEFTEIEKLAEEAKRQSTFWQKFRNFEFEINFENKKYMVWLLGAFASAAGLLSGLDQSIISGASIGMEPALHLTSHQQSLVSSLMPLGAVAGSILMTPLNEYFGRKKSIMISCVWYTVGAALSAAAHEYHIMYAGRFILGVGVGIEGGCVGLYIAESVPAKVRGNIVSMYQFNIAVGEVLGFAVAAMFYSVKGGWRFMIGSSLLFSTLLFIGISFLPESPRYLIHKNRLGEAYNVWKRLRDVEEYDSKVEFLEMRQAGIEEQERKNNESYVQVWMDLFTVPRNRRSLVYAVIMISLGQLTGVNAVMYYMSTLMIKIGFDTKNAVFMSLVGGGSLMLGTIPAILFMDRFGRRTWALNIVGFFFGLLLVAIGYRIDIETNLAAAEGVYLTGIILYMGFFGAYACLTWVLPSEAFSMQMRSVGMTISSAFLYLWAFTVTYNFTKMQNAFTYTGLTLGFYGGIAFIGFIYQLFFMPETKDKTLEEIDDIFNKPTMDIARENIANMKKFWGMK
ncbi:general substrate transporter [Scheffersomyces amazonensis]|uniref:general substrate transporter n=1 Tax=Scheffersomyces amazonensis TaxID=1078765 RepID=UPI00315D6F26